MTLRNLCIFGRMNGDNNHRALLLLGGNLGDRLNLLKETSGLIQKKIGRIEQSSSVYETEPWGFEHENPFLNKVLLVNTGLAPFSLLDIMLEIEAQMGRKRSKSGYEARVMDIDLLFYNNTVIHTQRLSIPHPYLHKRRFTLVPLVEIVPEWFHPVLNKTVKELLAECDDELDVKRYAG
ncbi:MAG: 2-amino-4-hydroxy-6-hydroxymethyldihydropteridine diphosphokinase [Bacteroidales bacterium]|nr:2-amino-4-hydroxy-6-hydroxymethyldihydropteridine diphosphokinase [Bacteroidales bacterium]